MHGEVSKHASVINQMKYFGFIYNIYGDKICGI